MQAALAKNKAETTSTSVSVSELKWVKGFGDKTIATLLENWITSLNQLKDISDEEAYKFLTPVQLHQIQLYIKTNNI